MEVTIASDVTPVDESNVEKTIESPVGNTTTIVKTVRNADHKIIHRALFMYISVLSPVDTDDEVASIKKSLTQSINAAIGDGTVMKDYITLRKLSDAPTHVVSKGIELFVEHGKINRLVHAFLLFKYDVKGVLLFDAAGIFNLIRSTFSLPMTFKSRLYSEAAPTIPRCLTSVKDQLVKNDLRLVPSLKEEDVPLANAVPVDIIDDAAALVPDAPVVVEPISKKKDVRVGEEPQNDSGETIRSMITRKTDKACERGVQHAKRMIAEAPSKTSKSGVPVSEPIPIVARPWYCPFV